MNDLYKICIYLQKVLKVPKIQEKNDNLLIHLLLQHGEKIKEMENKIDRQEEELRKCANNIEKMSKKHSGEIKILKKSLSTKQPITPVVGFHVSLSHNWARIGKVAFDKVISNYGNGWNSITNTFKAPTSGLYFLSLTVMNLDKHSVYTDLMRGSTHIAQAHAVSPHPYNVGTVATVLLLQAGEHIYAQHIYGTLHSRSPAHFTYLTGLLIHKNK